MTQAPLRNPSFWRVVSGDAITFLILFNPITLMGAFFVLFYFWAAIAGQLTPAWEVLSIPLVLAAVLARLTLARVRWIRRVLSTGHRVHAWAYSFTRFVIPPAICVTFRVKGVKHQRWIHLASASKARRLVDLTNVTLVLQSREGFQVDAAFIEEQFQR